LRHSAKRRAHSEKTWGRTAGRFDRNGEAEVDENSKLQITNNKQFTMTETPNSKSVLVIEYWNLRFNCNLVLGIWVLEMFDDFDYLKDFNGF
jgi:hypothetical protein